MTFRRAIRYLAAGFVACVPLRAVAMPEEEYRDKIRPLLEKHCYSCHGAEKQKGGLNLAEFSEFNSIVERPEMWELVFERVQAFEMPPEGAPQLKFDEQRRLVQWLRDLPRPEEPDCDKLASDRTQNFYRGYVMSRRLNRAEYKNTIRDLTGVDVNVDELLPADGGGGEGFDTSGNALFVSTIHIEKYLQAAERVLDAILADDPERLAPERRAARKRILVAEPSDPVAPREAARRVIGEFAARAYRRPVADDEIDRLLVMFERGWQRGDGFAGSIRLALKAVLISPNFLFLIEPEPAEGGIHRLGPYPLASRLSYFIWSSMPDQELMGLAANGRILDPEVYKQQIARMLSDPKADALGERFAVQWLDLGQLGSEVRPDPKKFPEFNAALNESMRREVIAFFNHLFRNDRSLLELIDSDYTFVNEHLAGLYGLQNVSGPDLQRVNLTDPNRGGVLGMAAIHTLTSYPLRTSPVLRGRWILESLLGDRVPPPPPDVPALEEESAETAHLSLRQQLEAHRTQAECAACHNRMDPLGFGLENFDVLGRWRDSDRGLPIDSQGTLPSGETFTGPSGLKKVMMARKDDVMRHLVRKMAGFAFGRELNKFDDCVVDRTMETLQANGYRASLLIEHLATSLPFQYRFYPKQEGKQD